ncbi:hypothetical protein TKK_0009839 [Trichogramma kaykai]
MNKMTNFIQTVAGRDCISTNYKGHMHRKSTLLEDVYKKGVYIFETERGTKESRPVVYANASKLLELIFENRDINTIEYSKIKLMADGGQGFFKISIAVLTEEFSKSDEHENQRALYSTGGSASKKRNLNSVYRLLLLGTVPRIKESHENMKTLFELTKINEIPFKFASDFKLMLIVNGQQTASSTYPCP